MIENYEKLETGVIKQIKVTPITYDPKYVQDRYDNYGIQCDMMSYLRYGFIVGIIGRKFQSILDVGYGNGSFLKICKESNAETFGTDISHYELKYGKFMEWREVFDKEFDVVTFFDSLEHFENISFLNKLKCNYICVSVPNCSYNYIELDKGERKADEYFFNWKHRRENEHIWHFDKNSLEKTMKKYGFKLTGYEYIEDIIRKPTSEYKNILTAIFENIK